MPAMRPVKQQNSRCRPRIRPKKQQNSRCRPQTRRTTKTYSFGAFLAFATTGSNPSARNICRIPRTAWRMRS